jgi:hypothetical protein
MRTLIFACLLSFVAISAQEWDEVSAEELEMTSLAEDPEAAAVVLFAIGNLKIGDEGRRFFLEMDVHKRIKILTEAGKEYANVRIPYYYKDSFVELEAVAHTPDGSKVWLESDAIFEEKRSRTMLEKAFAIPGAEIGSVVEYRYTLRSDYLSNLEPWVFQEGIFTRLSKVSVYLPAGFAYTALPLNTAAYDFRQSQERVRNPLDWQDKVQCYTWEARDLPALRSEPYTTALQDYYCSLFFQLISYESAYVYLQFAKNWDDIGKEMENQYGDMLNIDWGLKDKAKEVTAAAESDLEKAQLLYNFVRDELAMADEQRLFGDALRDPAEVLKAGEGNHTEHNLLLINLLRHAGLNADPLLISRRSEGRINPEWVTMSQFSRVITHCRIGGKNYYLNPAFANAPFAVLPGNYDVPEGLLFDDGKVRIVRSTYKPPQSGLDIVTEAQLTAEGTYSGTTQVTFSGVSGLAERNRLDNKGKQERAEDLVKQFAEDAVLDSFVWKNHQEPELPLELQISYHIDGLGENSDGIYYFSVPFYTALDKNPFVRETRNFPVTYDYAFKRNEEIKLHLPEGYKLDEVPGKNKHSAAGAKFTKIFFADGDVLECHRRLQLRKNEILPNDYPKYRRFNEELVASDAAQIVLIESGE